MPVFDKEGRGFKMPGFSGFLKKKTTKADSKIKEQLLEQLSKMKDPMNSNRGQSIANKLMDDFGMSGDELDSYV
jgi:hypothetical protein|tara:strand:+ start:284 stop:505 length:222 start_codon:yes stop_codon:yes gene_type:complete